jgi:hypothetical protein
MERGLLAFFSRRSVEPRWYQPMANRLRRHFGPGVDVRNFVWAGNNSVRARMWACDSLGDVVSRDSAASPVDAVYLLCHSHGGTVAVDGLLKHGARLAAEGISLAGLSLSLSLDPLHYQGPQKRRRPWWPSMVVSKSLTPND